MANDLLANTPNSRPSKNRSQAYAGTAPTEILNTWARKFQPLPAPAGNAPYRYNIETGLPGIGQHAAAAGKIVFHTVGDTGPYVDGHYLTAVAKAMKNDLQKKTADRPAFFYHLGDIVYNNGRHAEYYDQFYKPYQQYTAPIFSIPGNHDAEPADAHQKSLDGWTACFMSQQPHIDPISKDAPRLTMALPNVYYTLECPFVTIIGLYTNVPEHGILGNAQLHWLENELLAAPKDKALLVCLHNPVYSFDGQHSGSPLMAEGLATAINRSRRVPNMVLSAHVHNYQRMEKNIIRESPTPFLVAGNGGYYILHTITSEEGAVDELTGAKLIKAQNKNHGYVEITVDTENITGKAVVVDVNTGNTGVFDSFSYPVGARFLKEGVMVRL